MDHRVFASPPSIIFRAPHIQQRTDNLPIWNPVQPLTLTLPINGDPTSVSQEVRFASPIIEHDDSVIISESETLDCSPKDLENNKTAHLPTTSKQANQGEKDVYRNYQKVAPQVPRDHPARHQKTVAFGRTTNVSQTVEAAKDIAAFQRAFQPTRQPLAANAMDQPAAEKTQENKENAPQTKATLTTSARLLGTSNTKNGTDRRPSFESSQREIAGLKKEMASLKEEIEELKKKNAQQNEVIVKLQGQVIDLLTDKKKANLNLSSVSVQETISARHNTSQNRACQESRGAPTKNRATNNIMAGERRKFSPKLEQILSSDARIVESLWANDDPDAKVVSLQRTPIHSVFNVPLELDRVRKSVTPSRRYTVEHPPEEEFEELEDDYEETRPRNQRNIYDRNDRNDREERQRRIQEIRHRLATSDNETRMMNQEDEFGEY